MPASMATPIISLPLKDALASALPQLVALFAALLVVCCTGANVVYQERIFNAAPVLQMRQ